VGTVWPAQRAIALQYRIGHAECASATHGVVY